MSGSICKGREVSHLGILKTLSLKVFQVYERGNICQCKVYERGIFSAKKRSSAPPPPSIPPSIRERDFLGCQTVLNN